MEPTPQVLKLLTHEQLSAIQHKDVAAVMSLFADHLKAMAAEKGAEFAAMNDEQKHKFVREHMSDAIRDHHGSEGFVSAQGALWDEAFIAGITTAIESAFSAPAVEAVAETTEVVAATEEAPAVEAVATEEAPAEVVVAATEEAAPATLVEEAAAPTEVVA